MYLTSTDQANLLVTVGRVIEDTKLIRGIITSDMLSHEKRLMREGVDYFLGKHDILKKDFQKYWIDQKEYRDKDAANNRVKNPFHQLFIKDKKAYLLSNNPTIEDFNDDKLLNKKFYKTLRRLATNSSCKGYEWLHPFVNSDGEFDYTITDAENCIPDYDRDGNLLSMLRHYLVDSINDKGELKKITKAEVWTDTQVYFYIETNGGDFVLDQSEENNPRPHWVTTQTINKKSEVLAIKGFGKVPFIKVQNNEEGLTDLDPIKDLIDIYDLIASGYANNLEDIQEAVWNLKNYEGEDLREFRQALKTFKVIKTDADGGAEPLTVPIPVEAKNALLGILEKNIYRFGRAFNSSDENFAGQITGVALRYKYQPLDLKCGELATELNDFVSQFFEFYSIFNESYQEDFENIKLIFNKSTLVNKKEEIENINLSTDLSLRTRLELHPDVKNVDEELERIGLEGNGLDDLDDE